MRLDTMCIHHMPTGNMDELKECFVIEPSTAHQVRLRSGYRPSLSHIELFTGFYGGTQKMLSLTRHTPAARSLLHRVQ